MSEFKSLLSCIIVVQFGSHYWTLFFCFHFSYKGNEDNISALLLNGLTYELTYIKPLEWSVAHSGNSPNVSYWDSGAISITSASAGSFPISTPPVSTLSSTLIKQALMALNSELPLLSLHIPLCTETISL